MAKVLVGIVKIEMTHAELALIRRGLELIKDYGDYEDVVATSQLLSDLEVTHG
ncbi:hypothetical protein [Streptomyces sp. NPDC053048]|uniref:hypothetical protein n=1 Tax=Streptomyces sp. NPDC053048 TaxID=3365694 RepID=UPI0037D11CE3